VREAFAKEGADAWFKSGARERFLGGLVDDPSEWEKVDDILDVWFDSGCTHAFTLERRADLKPRRRKDGGADGRQQVDRVDRDRRDDARRKVGEVRE
jgi:isoleucyl-tRNA synthetase